MAGDVKARNVAILIGLLVVLAVVVALALACALVAGLIGGHLLHYYGEVVKRPSELWWVLAGIGALTVVLMALYNSIFVPKTAAAS